MMIESCGPNHGLMIRQLLRETVHGYVFWCLFQALAPMIWFYPLNELKITGYEAFSVMTLTPVILESTTVINFLQTHPVLSVLRLLSVASLASFQAPNTLSRLIILTLGTTCALLVFTVTLWSPDARIRCLSFWGIILGLFSFLVSRIWFVTFVPTWWSPTTNSVVIAIAVIVTFDHILSGSDHIIDTEVLDPTEIKTSVKHSKHKALANNGNSVNHEDNDRAAAAATTAADTNVPPVEKSENNIPSESITNGDTPKEKKHQTRRKAKAPSSFLVGLGFGSLIFLTEWVFGEVSLICRWVVEGYPNHGPSPYPWGCPVLLCLALGVYLSQMSFTKSILWWLAGVGSLFVLYYQKTWYGYLGGLFLSVFTLTIWPHMVDQVTKCPPGRTMFVSMLTWLVEILFFVWTIAYNFVPGGFYTREHSDYLIAFISITLIFGYFIGGSELCTSHVAYVKFKTGDYSKVAKKVLFIITCVGLLGFGSRYQAQEFEPPKESNNSVEYQFVGPYRRSATARNKFRLYVPHVRYCPETAVNRRKFRKRLVSACCPPKYFRRYQKIKQPTKKIFTAAIWTFHFGYDNYGWPSMERAEKLLRETGADFITLLESDASKPFLGNNDLGMWFGEKLGMYVDFGPATKKHTWGNLILSKYPIVKSVHHLLPSPQGELAPAITATINISGSLVNFVVTHMGNHRDSEDRRQQAKFLSKELRNCNNPTVFLGYVTSPPYSRDYFQLIQDGYMEDIEPGDRFRWCQYIMYKKLIKLAYARISRGHLSDTEIQMAKFQIPHNLKYYKDRYRITVLHDDVEEYQRFSEKFGHFYARSAPAKQREHKFHMATPKYFV